MGFVKRVVLSAEEYFKLPKMRRRDVHNREVVDPVPIAPPIGWYKQPSMFDQVRDMVRSEHMRLYAEARGDETFEDANDFNVEDDPFPSSQYEDGSDFEPLEDLQARRQAEYDIQWRREREERRRKKEKKEWAEDEVVGRPPEAAGSPSSATPSKPAPQA